VYVMLPYRKCVACARNVNSATEKATSVATKSFFSLVSADNIAPLRPRGKPKEFACRPWSRFRCPDHASLQLGNAPTAGVRSGDRGPERRKIGEGGRMAEAPWGAAFFSEKSPRKSAPSRWAFGARGITVMQARRGRRFARRRPTEGHPLLPP